MPPFRSCKSVRRLPPLEAPAGHIASAHHPFKGQCALSIASVRSVGHYAGAHFGTEGSDALALERKASEALVLARDSQLYVEQMFPAGTVLVMEEGVGLVVVHELLDDGVPFEGTVQFAGYDADVAHGA